MTRPLDDCSYLAVDSFFVRRNKRCLHAKHMLCILVAFCNIRIPINTFQRPLFQMRMDWGNSVPTEPIEVTVVARPVKMLSSDRHRRLSFLLDILQDYFCLGFSN